MTPAAEPVTIRAAKKIGRLGDAAATKPPAAKTAPAPSRNGRRPLRSDSGPTTSAAEAAAMA